MQRYPHVYETTATGAKTGDVTIEAARLETLRTAPPAEFGGPGNLWSPETLLAASVADCFVLTLRAVSRTADVEWHSVDCRVQATLDRVDGIARFTRIVTRVVLTVPEDTDAAAARRLLERAEKDCLIANSLLAERHLDAEIVIGRP